MSIFTITKLCIKKDSSSPVNLHLDNYSTEQTPTEMSAGGALLYMRVKDFPITLGMT